MKRCLTPRTDIKRVNKNVISELPMAFFVSNTSNKGSLRCNCTYSIKIDLHYGMLSELHSTSKMVKYLVVSCYRYFFNTNLITAPSYHTVYLAKVF